MNLIERITQPTPRFFKIVRNIGLALAAISGSLLAAPVVLPAIIMHIAGYVAIAGGIMTAVSQAAVTDDVE